MVPLIAAASDISRTGLYLSQPQRATHSMSSEKESVVIDWFSPAPPADIWSSDCEFMKANLACGIESEHLKRSRHDGSPVISDSRCTSQMPTTLPFLRISCHWS